MDCKNTNVGLTPTALAVRKLWTSAVVDMPTSEQALKNSC